LIPDEVKLVDAAESSGQAAFPGPMPSRARVHRGLAAGLRRAAQDPLRGALATTLGITTSNALARRIERASGCHAENLEALAVALACQSERVAFAALLLITNVVGSRGRAQWVEQHTAAADRGAAIVLDWIARGAPGLPPRK
jgi:nucleoside phosphorylase